MDSNLGLVYRKSESAKDLIAANKAVITNKKQMVSL
jgi:hypothetical protein